MVLNILSISDENIQRLHANPKLILKVIYPGSKISSETNDLFSYLSKLLNLFLRLPKRNAVLSISLDPTIGEKIGLDLDKSWHGIQYLLTRTAWKGEFPANFLISGTEIGDIDVGYGSAKAFSSAEVKKIHKYLAKITQEELFKNYYPRKMMEAEIYPEIWDRAEEKEMNKRYLTDYFAALKTFIEEVANRNLGIIIWLN